MQDSNPFPEVTPLTKRLLQCLIERAYVRNSRSFRLHLWELRLAAGIRSVHEAELQSQLRIIGDLGLIRFAVDGSHVDVDLLESCEFDLLDAEIRERHSRICLRRTLLFFVYDRTADSGRLFLVVPIDELAPVMDFTDEEVERQLLALRRHGYLKWRLHSKLGRLGGYSIEAKSMDLCEDRQGLFESMCGVPPAKLHEADPAASAAALEIRLGTREVLVGGRSVDLTPTEFCILHELAKRPGNLIPHHKLADLVTRSGLAGDPGAFVKNHKAKLRKKLAAGGQSQPDTTSWIDTVNGCTCLRLPESDVRIVT